MSETITRSQFERQIPAARRRIVRDGIGIVDDPPAPRVVLKEGEISRLDFDAMSQADRRRVVADRMKVVDL